MAPHGTPYSLDEPIGVIVEDRRTFSSPYLVKCGTGKSLEKTCTAPDVECYYYSSHDLRRSYELPKDPEDWAAKFEPDDRVSFKLDFDDVSSKDWKRACEGLGESWLGFDSRMFFYKNDEVELLEKVSDTCFTASNRAGAAPLFALKEPLTIEVKGRGEALKAFVTDVVEVAVRQGMERSKVLRGIEDFELWSDKTKICTSGDCRLTFEQYFKQHKVVGARKLVLKQVPAK
jgi:hypothetical protein